MNNWYFGDVNDYQKYGVLRAIQKATAFRILVVWMLTEVEARPKGCRHTGYLSKPEEWRECDPGLFDRLRQLVVPGEKGDVRLVERSGLLRRTRYYRDWGCNDKQRRQSWADALLKQVDGVDLVFLDPDTGLEVRSTPLGKKDSAKYVYWEEVEELWQSGVSLLIYQHFPRQTPHEEFLREAIKNLSQHTRDSVVGVFRTRHMLLLLAMQPHRAKQFLDICRRVDATWKDIIKITVYEPPGRPSGTA